MAYKFGLAGDPVEHSLSPAMHRAAFAASGLDGTYSLIRCDARGFIEVVKALRGGIHDGLNVTMPHKRRAYDVSTRLTPGAAASESVNTLKIEDSEVVGHSSDYVAFVESFRLLGSPSQLVILGAGGSASAAIAAFDGPVHVWARRPEAIADLVQRFGQRVRPWSGTTSSSVVVNCTPIGMHEEVLPEHLVGEASGVIDLPYGPIPTPLALESERSSRPLVDGRRFLALQAAESFRWWTGHEVDPDTMVAAARNG